MSHEIVMPSLIMVNEDEAAFGLVAVPTTAPTTAATTVAAGGTYTLSAPLIGNAGFVYATSTVSDGGDGAYSGPVVEVALASGAQRAVTTDYGSPIAVVDGYLYYQHDDSIERVPLAGGATTTVVPAIPAGAFEDRAIDGDFVYTTTPADPFTIVRFPVAGGASTPVITLSQGGELPLGAPSFLRRDGDYLYFLLGGNGGGEPGYGVLSRLRLDGSSQREVVSEELAMCAPAFDATNIYVAYQRGGGDVPIEGVIAAIAK
jgi:hypothetical protein